MTNGKVTDGRVDVNDGSAVEREELLAALSALPAITEEYCNIVDLMDSRMKNPVDKIGAEAKVPRNVPKEDGREFCVPDKKAEEDVSVPNKKFQMFWKINCI